MSEPSVPIIKNIHQAVYAAASREGALDMSLWHSQCGTAHCRAGWVIHLAGEAGYELEKIHGTSGAAELIYQANGYDIDIDEFYASHGHALYHMKLLADLEAKGELPRYVMKT